MYHKKTISFFIITIITASLFLNFYIENSKAAPYIEVKNPSSGDILYAGNSVTITWDYFDLDSNYVKIELYESGDWVQEIDSYYYNYGHRSWNVPDTVDESSSYQIKISDQYNSSIYDFSDYFTIDYQRSITVRTPSSSSTWYKGESYSIRWNSEYAENGNVAISLYKDDTLIEEIDDDVNNNDGYNYYGYNSYSWTVPNDLTIGDDYQIKITSNFYDDVEDFSNVFSIDERTLTVTKPEHKSVWYKGQEYTVEWTSRNAGSYVKIELYEDDNYKSTIESSTTNDGTYNWFISSSLSVDSIYKIKVSSTYYSNVYDISESIFLKERSLSFLTDFSGKTWFPNETHEIEWTENDSGTSVDLILYKDNIYCGTVANDIANTGSYTWIISKEYTPSNGYHMMIKSNQYDTIKDESKKFSIGGREIEVQDLKKNQVLYMGDDFIIKWDANNAGEYLDIILYKNDKKLYTIAKRVKGSEGSYSWKIPENLTESNDYQIKIESSSFSSVSSFSEKFSIEQTLMDKISTPLMIIVGTIVFIVCTIGLISFFRNRKNKAKKSDENPAVSYKSFEQKGIIKNDTSQKEYDNIWEKNNF